MMDSARVFISYCHRRQGDPTFQTRVIEIARRLRAAGLEAILDEYLPEPPPSWPVWMHQQIRNADRVLIIGSAEYKDRVENPMTSGRSTGAAWEGAIVTSDLYDDLSLASKKFVPAILGGEHREQVPYFLRQTTVYDLLDDRDFSRLVNHLRGIPPVDMPPVASDTWAVDRGFQPSSATAGGILGAPVAREDLVRVLEQPSVSLDELIFAARQLGWTTRETEAQTRFYHESFGAFLVPRRAYQTSTVVPALVSALRTLLSTDRPQ